MFCNVLKIYRMINRLHLWEIRRLLQILRSLYSQHDGKLLRTLLFSLREETKHEAYKVCLQNMTDQCGNSLDEPYTKDKTSQQKVKIGYCLMEFTD